MAISSFTINAQVGPEAADNTANINADYSANADGSDDSTAFLAFNAAERNNVGLTELSIAGDYELNDFGARRFFEGFESLRVVGDGPTTTNLGRFRFGGLHLTNSPMFSARLESVTKGDTTVTIKDVDPARRNDGSTGDSNRTLAQMIAIFSVGDWVVLSACDLQSGGYPPNPAFCHYAQITDITGSVVTLSRPANSDFSDAFPVYNNGTANNGGVWEEDEIDQGGPATMYKLDDTWGGDFHIKDMTVSVTPAQALEGSHIAMAGRTLRMDNIKYDDTAVALNERPQAWPSSAIHIIQRSCDLDSVEVDKLFERWTVQNTDARFLKTQSPAPLDLLWQGGTVERLQGTPLRAVYDGVTFTGEVRVGPTSYGHTERLTFQNCAFPDAATEDWITGSRSEDTTGMTISGNTLTGPRPFGRRWAVPGAFISLNISPSGPAFGARVVSVSDDGTNTTVTLDATVPSYSAGSFTGISLHACPDISVINCTGGPTTQALNAAPNNSPLGAFHRFTINTSGNVVGSDINNMGRVVSYTVNVTKPYTGSSANLFFHLHEFGAQGFAMPGGAVLSGGDKWSPGVNLKVAGERVYAPGGDTGLDASDSSNPGDVYLSRSNNPVLRTGAAQGSGSTVDISAEDPSVWPEFTAELLLDPFYVP